MAFTDSTTITYKTQSGAVSQFSADEAGGQRQTPSVTVPASTTNYHVPLSTVSISQLISFLIYSSKNVTVKTNSSSSPDQTFSLSAGIGLTWNNANGQDNPLTIDITDLYFTNPGSAAALVQMSFLES